MKKGAKHLDFEGVAQQSEMETSSIETSIEMVFESDIHDIARTIRRIKGKSRVSCQGWLGRQQGKCKKVIKNTATGVLAPLFWGVFEWSSSEGDVESRR